MMALRHFAARTGMKALGLIGRLAAWRWRESRKAWECAWNEPVRGLRLVYLASDSS